MSLAATGAQSTDLHSPLSQNFALEGRRSSIHHYFPRNFPPRPLPLLFSQSISICLHSECSRNRSFGRVQAVPEEYQALSRGIGVENGRNGIVRLPLDIKEKPPLPTSQLLSWSLRGGRQKKQHVYGFSLTYPSTNATHHCIMTQA